jgi:predicted ATPase/class 3 adenylate cyclase
VTEGLQPHRQDEPIPTGIVTFLFTDVERSTRLWAEDRDAMSASLQVHDRLLRDAVESRAGYVFTTAGDSFAVAFGRASEAVAAAQAAQDSLAAAEWPGPMLRVRMGLHVGEAEERGGDYFGPVVNLTARLEAAGHGGQVLMTDPVRQAAGIAASDLGVHVLRDVSEPLQIWQLDCGDFPPLRVVDPQLTNPPSAPTTLVGRSDDLVRIRGALGSSRVVTLTAGGGTGKTRLAIAVGEQEMSDRPDGVWFVDLTPVSDEALVAPSIAAGLGLNLVSRDATEQILDYVANKNLLLIIDNCEHLIDECAKFGQRFVARPGGSVVLATSRERFDIDGERAIRLGPLSTDDDEGSAAVELFAQRASAVNSSFVLSEDNGPVVAQLCRHLDGMPLAIELAAARSGVMTPVELLAGIEDRFELLAGGRRRQRQRTLEATLDWSYNLLEADEQQVLRALGVFPGTFDLDAVAAITELGRVAAVDIVDSLTAKSLVVHEEVEGRSRFRLFETTAAYAGQRLADTGEGTPVRDRHLNHFFGLAQRYPVAMFADLAARQTLGADKDNIVAAHNWAARKQDWTTAAELLVRAFTVFYGHPIEGRALPERCLEQLPQDQHHLAMCLVCNQFIPATQLWDIAHQGVIVRALRDSPTPLHQVYGYGMLAFILKTTNPEATLQLLDKALEIEGSLPPGTDTTQAAAVRETVAGTVSHQRQEPELALQHALTAIRLHDELGFDSELSAQAIITAAICSLELGDPHAALQRADRYGAVSSGFGTGDEIRTLAWLALGELDRARAACQAHARVTAPGRLIGQATDSLLLLAALSNAEGDVATARALVLNLGLCRHDQLNSHSKFIADQLGVRAEFDASRLGRAEWGEEEVRRTNGADIETLRLEITRRGW